MTAEEAYAIGLVNRLVPRGTALPAALQLATEIAAVYVNRGIEFLGAEGERCGTHPPFFPPHHCRPQTCMRNDRLATYAAEGLPMDAALRVEYTYGVASLADSAAKDGATRFAQGAGRHGAAASLPPPVAPVAAPPVPSTTPSTTTPVEGREPRLTDVESPPVRALVDAPPSYAGGIMNATSLMAISRAAAPFGMGAAGGVTRGSKPAPTAAGGAGSGPKK